MFWGLVLEPGKRYSTTVEKSFHVSKAVLDCASIKSDNEVLNVILETEGSESLLCNLCKQKGILQESLDLNFMQGDRLTFECRGNGRIHLSGYILPDDDDEYPTLGDDEEESEEEESDLSAPSSPIKSKKEKRKSEQLSAVPSKKSKIEAEDEDEDLEDDSDEDFDSDTNLSDLDDTEGLGDDDEEGEDDDDESDEDSPQVKPKQQKKDNQNKTPNKQNQQTPKKTPVTNGVTKEQKSNKKTPGGDKSPNTTPKHKQTLENGVVIKDIKLGTGPVATKGKVFGRISLESGKEYTTLVVKQMSPKEEKRANIVTESKTVQNAGGLQVKVHYLGKLKENNKVFDKNMKGDGFKFKLGKGEVIKGWEVGVQGMKVGGKRIIHCPPEAAYGAKGAPPQIPGNSSLIFEVELKSIL